VLIDINDEILNQIIVFMEGCQAQHLKILICYNLPAISIAIGKEKFISKIFPLFEKLVYDTNIQVRAKAIGCIHQVIP
jgi:hypothetical protein